MKMKKPLGYYDYTVVLTYVGMLCAIIAIFLSINMNYLDAVIFLMLSGVCDMFDGTIAATKNRNANEKRFGIQIDSLSDLISFGIMPAVFVLFRKSIAFRSNSTPLSRGRGVGGEAFCDSDEVCEGL